jgi:GMP synthase-like glutamine amidotransferase
MMKVNVLLCDVFEDIMPFENVSYNSMLMDMINRVRPDIKIRYEFFEAFARDLPDTIEEDALYIIPGSRFDAYSDTPWLLELRHFIQELHDEKVKMLGICFGHQLIAETLGGRVEKAVVGTGLGVRNAKMISNKLSKELNLQEIRLNNYHQDQVVSLPKNATIHASSEFCPIELYSIDKNIICIQGHPEYDSNYMRYLIRNHSLNTSEITRMKALKSLEIELNSNETTNYLLKFLNF